MEKIRIALIGYGNVGQAFARMLERKKDFIEERFGKTPVISAIVTGIVLLMFFTGMYFIRQIVIPIRGIADITHKYAKGDFSKRIEKKSEDELGEICD